MATSSAFPLLLSLPPAKPTSGIRRGSHFRVATRPLVAENTSGSTDALTPLYDDGYGTRGIRDYIDAARDVIRPDGGPPRWFCPVECGQPITGSPLLMFLPDIDGTGMGLILHHKSLGKVFEVRCLHIPMSDRTPFEGLVKIVEDSVKREHALSPNRPIYLLGDSFGGCIALSVAACNPSIDLVLVLVNPATSYNDSKLQPFIPVLEALPHDLYTGVPYALSLIMGDPIKMAMSSIVEDLPPQQSLVELSKNLLSFLPLLSNSTFHKVKEYQSYVKMVELYGRASLGTKDLLDALPKDTLLWKLKLLKYGSSYSSSRLHAVEAQVLVIASGNDNLLPSGEEAKRLWTSLKNCKVRYFKDSGHTLLLEDRINLLTVIKGTGTYRRSRHHDFVTDYLPLTMSEYRKLVARSYGLVKRVLSPVFLSTLENGRIVRGLSGVPSTGPVLFVGNHMFMGLELSCFNEFMTEKNMIVRGLAHPFIAMRSETSQEEFAVFDNTIVLGRLPVSPKNIYKLLSSKSFILLYPGGVREAYHRKGEEYKLFWPEQPEFVRMAARFGATIVPFGVVGEDDVIEMLMDYNDQMKMPFMKKWIEQINNEPGRVNIRADMDGEISKQDVHYPVVAPKVPGRFYFLFGKPYETRGMDSSDRDRANEMYLQIKSDVEDSITYLRKKREEDPYRSILQRTIYQSSRASDCEVPTFEP